VSKEPDPERLLAQALRAQAVRAPRTDPVPAGEPVLLSGGDSLLSGRSIEQPTAVTDSQYTAQLRSRPAPLSVWWIVLLAILLGLAAGAVVGLVSVL
jgi:hypothetical protein